MGKMHMPSMTYTYSGDLKGTRGFLNRLKQDRFVDRLDKYGQMGVKALRDATPRDTGKTANSWDYVIEQTRDSVTITWTNSNENRSIPIALLIQYGHATRNGGWISGIDYINPALKPIFEQIATSAWKEVSES
jgi:hypothetical protein